MSFSRNVAMLEYYHKNNYVCDSADSFCTCNNDEYFHVVKWLRNHNYPHTITFNQRTICNIDKFCGSGLVKLCGELHKFAILHNNLDSLLWLYQHFPIQITDVHIRIAADNRNIIILQWLRWLGGKYTLDIIKEARQSCDVDIINYMKKWVVE